MDRAARLEDTRSGCRIFSTEFEREMGLTCGTVMMCWERPASEVLKVICFGSMTLLELAADRDTVLKDRESPG